MSDCCSDGTHTEPHESARGACFLCRTKGEAVDVLTVKAMLTERALARFDSDNYRFCAGGHCPIVYFNGAGRAFSTQDLRVPVWQKSAPGARVVCYCFGENEADIALEIERTGASLAVARVRAHIMAGRCVCEVRNPRGSCCLRDVTAAVNRIAARHGKARS